MLGIGPTTYTLFLILHREKKIDCLGQAEQNGLKHYTFIRKDTNIRCHTLFEYLLYESLSSASLRVAIKHGISS